MAWKLMEGEKSPHFDTHLTSLVIPLARDARTKTSLYHKIHLSKVDAENYYTKGLSNEIKPSEIFPLTECGPR